MGLSPFTYGHKKSLLTGRPNPINETLVEDYLVSADKSTGGKVLITPSLETVFIL